MYNPSTSTTMSASPIEIIYGFNLSSPLYQVPIPTTNQFRSDIEKEGRAKIEKSSQNYNEKVDKYISSFFKGM